MNHTKRLRRCWSQRDQHYRCSCASFFRRAITRLDDVFQVFSGWSIGYCCRMNFRPRKHLPHEIPLWVDPHKEIYFITVNCRHRFRNQLALPVVAGQLFETIKHRQEKSLWWPYLFLLMPDHLHALLSFPPSDKPIRGIVCKWKEWTAKDVGVDWQDDFFEHRLRHDESRRQKADYILANPVRANLVSRPEDWLFVYFGGGEKPKFAD